MSRTRILNHSGATAPHNNGQRPGNGTSLDAQSTNVRDSNDTAQDLPLDDLMRDPENSVAVWKELAAKKIEKTPECEEALYLKALEFLEKHLRQRLSILDKDPVRIGFPLSDAVNLSSMSLKNREPQPAHGLPDSAELDSMYLKYSSPSSERKWIILNLYVAPPTAGTHQAPQVTICLDFLHDRWCVGAILLACPPGSKQAAAVDLFLPSTASPLLDPKERPAYNNWLR